MKLGFLLFTTKATGFIGKVFIQCIGPHKKLMSTHVEKVFFFFFITNVSRKLNNV